MPLTTTAGKVLLLDIFPDDMKEDVMTTTLDEDGIDYIMGELYQKHPEEYATVLYKLNDLGSDVSSTYGEFSSIDLESLTSTDEIKSINKALKQDLKEIAISGLPVDEKKKLSEELLTSARAKLEELASDYVEDKAFGIQRKSGAKDKLQDITNILAGETSAIDFYGGSLPYAVTRGYGAGLTPFDYFLAGQKAREGLVGTKLATPDAGDISNQLSEAALRLRITQNHEPEGYNIGIFVPVDDPDYEGSVLSMDIEGVAKRGQELTPDIVNRLKDKGVEKVMIHSPLSSAAPYGISKDSVGHSLNKRPELGDFPGLTAVQSLMETFTQRAISSKHVGQRAFSGLDMFRQLISVPQKFSFKSAASKETGVVTDVKELDSGAHLIYVNGNEHFVEPGLEVNVKTGDKVKAGDLMSEGLPSSRELVEILGIGGGRKKFADLLSEKFREIGISHNKRIPEFLSRGLINHVRIKDRYKDFLPGDIIEYGQLQREYEPAEDTTEESINVARGKYLQKPVAYHTIGTKVTKDMVKELKEMGIEKVSVSGQEPFWEPEVRPARGALQYTDDPLMRMYGSSVKRNLLDALYRGQGETDLDRPTSIIGQMVIEGAPRSLLPGEKERLKRLPTYELDQLFAN